MQTHYNYESIVKSRHDNLNGVYLTGQGFGFSTKAADSNPGKRVSFTLFCVKIISGVIPERPHGFGKMILSDDKLSSDHNYG